MKTLMCLLTSVLAAPTVAGARPVVVAYVPNWIDLPAYAKTIDYDKVTHVNLAFENPTNDAGDLSFNAKDDALIKEAHSHSVKALVSLGGGSAAENKPLIARYFALISDPNRAAFVQSLVDYVALHDLDGLDVDLEGPSINKDYGPFIAELAKALHAKGKLVTAALSKGYGGESVPDSALADLDLVNIMAYDATGYWDPNRPGQHSSMEFARESVDYWLKRGLPKSKAVLGVPFYGHGFGRALKRGDYSYRNLVETYPGAENQDQAGETIWYNGIPTIKAKAQYVRDQGLGGIMIWELEQDAPGEKSLLTAIDRVLRPPAKP
jgi:chitinase